MCFQSMTEASVHPWAIQRELSEVLNAPKVQPSLTEATSKKAIAALDALKLKMLRKP
jgi:hypothetical protein